MKKIIIAALLLGSISANAQNKPVKDTVPVEVDSLRMDTPLLTLSDLEQLNQVVETLFTIREKEKYQVWMRAIEQVIYNAEQRRQQKALNESGQKK